MMTGSELDPDLERLSASAFVSNPICWYDVFTVAPVFVAILIGMPGPAVPSVALLALAPLKNTSFKGGAYGLDSVSPSWLVKNVLGRG